LKDLLSQYKEEDVYNMDETGLFYRMNTDKTLHFKGERCEGGKQSKERITVAVCANMAGTDKLPLLVVGKFQNPRCFKNVNTLPVQYYANKKAWMLSDIFKKWVQQLDNKMTLLGRKILLFVDNCPAHPEVPGLKAVNLQFLPPNTTSVLQPMDQGIIRALKFHYRKQSLQLTIDHLDEHGERPRESLNILQAIRFCNTAWTRVTAECIRNCFHHGFKMRDEECVGVPAIDTSELQDMVQAIDPADGVTADDILSADSNAMTTEAMTDAEIVSCAQSVHNDNDDMESEEDDVIPEPIPSYKEASKSLNVLMRHLESLPDSAKHVQELYNIQNHIDVKRVGSLKQSSLLDFFTKK